MKKKGLLAVLLSASMVLPLVACGTKAPSDETAQTATESTEEAEQEEPEEKAETVKEEVTEEAKDEPKEETEASASLMGVNMIENGDFSQGLGDWMTYLNGGNATLDVNSDGQMQVDVIDIGDKEYSVQIYYDGFALEKGCVYEMSFDAASTAPRDLEYRIQINDGDYHAYNGECVSLNTEMNHYDYQFTMEEESDPAPRLCFNMGIYEATDPAIGNHSITFDNLELYCIDESGRASSAADSAAPHIMVNQIGYLPGAGKTAVFRGEDIDTKFSIVDADSGKSVYDGTVSKASWNEQTGENEAAADFSDFKTPGTYRVVGEKCGESYEFTISDDVYADAFQASVKMLYLQRCGEEVKAENAGDFAHPVCHATEAVIYGTKEKKDVSGGWHDAGDYGRYVVSGAKAVADILLAYEKNPKAFDDAEGIPESGNGTPDILDEAGYELTWMLKMQDSKSGGVYHKVTCANFPETVLPQDETEELILSPISNTATGDFAAVMAMAARVYQKSDASFADKCLKAAKKAMTYLDSAKAGEGFKNPSDIVTGEYPDGDDTDERLWANAELFKTTGDAAYEKALTKLEFTQDMVDLGWAQMGFYGAFAYLTSDYTNKTYAKGMQDKMMGCIKELSSIAAGDTYQSTAGATYSWGSNMTMANHAELFIMADEINGNDKFQRLAEAQTDYLLGNNTNGYCFLTGFGTVSPKNTHHRPSQVLGKSMEGMLVGGPDSNLEDPYAQATLSGVAPAKCYVDNAQSYSCNEVTIYWNSPLIYVLSSMQ